MSIPRKKYLVYSKTLVHYKNGMGRTQNHSIGIRLQHACIDVVPAIAPLLMQPGIFGEKNTTSILYNYIFSSVARECAIRLALTGESVGRVPEWKRGNLSTLEGIANSKEKWKAMRGYICRSLHAMLKEFNLSYREPSKMYHLVYYENDKNEKLAGLVGETFGNWLCIKYLFVSEDLRGQGIGKKIMESAEQVARKRGCKFAFVDTFSFQAQDSIRNLGIKRCLC